MFESQTLFHESNQLLPAGQGAISGKHFSNNEKMVQQCPEAPTATAVDPEKTPGVEYYKEQAINCLKSGEYREAALFLTTAIHRCV